VVASENRKDSAKFNHSAKIWGKFSGRENARLKFWGNLAE